MKCRGIPWMLLLLSVAPAVAAPLPQDPALDRPITFAVTNQTVGRLVGALGRAGGMAMTADAHLEQCTLTLSVRDCPLRDVMLACAASVYGEWEAQPEGGYRLRGPSVIPPVMDTKRLARVVSDACPRSIRPQTLLVPPETNPQGFPNVLTVFPPGSPLGQVIGGLRGQIARTPVGGLVAGMMFGEELPPMGKVYASLPKQYADWIEDGGEIPFPRLPAAAQQALRDYRDSIGRKQAADALNPGWFVSPQCLGLRFRNVGAMLAMLGGNIGQAAAGGYSWELVSRKPAAPAPGPAPADGDQPQWTPWATVSLSPYQPMLSSMLSLVPGTATGMVNDAVLAVAQQQGLSVVVPGILGPGLAGQPAGQTPDELLTSITSTRRDLSWRRAGKAYVLLREPAAPVPPSPELLRARQKLEDGLPAEYKTLLEMPAAERYYAVLAGWAKLWNSLTDQQRKSTTEIVAADLTNEQQTLLYATLQAQMVESVWTAIEQSLSGDLQRAVLAMDFDTPATDFDVLGVARTLVLRDGQAILAYGAAEGQPPMLRLLPANDPALGRRVDVALKDGPLSQTADTLTTATGAPVVIAEPDEETKFTLDLKQRPVRLLMHWLERHTGMVWTKRDGAFVLSPPVPVKTLVANFKRATDVISTALPPPPADGTDAMAALRKGVTEDDRKKLDRGARLGDLSQGAQDAIRAALASRARDRLGLLNSYWSLYEQLGNARVYVDKGRRGSSDLRIAVPNGPSRSFNIPAPGDGGGPGGGRGPFGGGGGPFGGGGF